MWGFRTDQGEAGYWPFGHLLVKFQKLAADNLLAWPLNTRSQWRSLAYVQRAMANTFAELCDDEDEIAAEYELFLELSEYCDWEAIVANRNIHFVDVYMLWGEHRKHEWKGEDRKVYCDGKPVKVLITVQGLTRADAILTINRAVYELVTPE